MGARAHKTCTILCSIVSDSSFSVVLDVHAVKRIVDVRGTSP